MNHFHRVAVAAALCAITTLAYASSDQVDSAIMPPDVSVKTLETWRSDEGAHAAQLAFQPLADERIDALKRSNASERRSRVQVGVHRDAASEAEFSDLSSLSWVPVDGGFAARIEVVSPGANGLRVAIRPDRLPDGVEIRVAGDADASPMDKVYVAQARSLIDGNGSYWTSVTDGERQQLEFFAPSGIDLATVVPRIDAIAHLLVEMFDPAGPVLKGLGDSGACNINAVCGDAPLGQAYVNARNSVAWMNFMSGGSSYVCTGTLLNDLDTSTFTPWFYTAHHCIGTQAEANSLSTFWRREAATCNGTGAGANIQVGGGAQMMYSQGSTDGALLRLNGAPPAGAVFAGWNSAALAANTDIIGIHHPSGDNKKVSVGRFVNVTSNVNIGGQVVGSALRVTWLEGTTEGGSSGSGLFTLNNGGYQLRGGLFGGSASCADNGNPDDPDNRDFYSSLQVVFPAISQYIANAGGGQNGPTRDYTGQWSAAAEAGRGLSLFQFPNVLFGLWFIYDGQGRASWYQLDPAWTGRDVASGRVVRWTGSPWAPTYNPNVRTFVEVGNFTLTFTSATAATFAYNVDGVNRTITMNKL
jgi:lysyl endopeptidase